MDSKLGLLTATTIPLAAPTSSPPSPKLLFAMLAPVEEYMPKALNLVGQKFNKLTVVKFHGRTNAGQYTYYCKCDCGKETIGRTGDLRNGHQKSCGCMAEKYFGKKRKYKPAFKHGLSLKNHPEYKRYQRECFDRTKYGLEPEAKARMVADQKNQCAICGYSFGQKKGDMKVDHCHKTNVVRGLLCDHCNRGLGFFKETVKSLEGAIAYLEKNSVMLVS